MQTRPPARGPSAHQQLLCMMSVGLIYLTTKLTAGVARNGAVVRKPHRSSSSCLFLTMMPSRPPPQHTDRERLRCRRQLSSSSSSSSSPPSPAGIPLSPFREMSPPYYHLVYNGSVPPVPSLETAPQHLLRLKVEGKGRGQQDASKAHAHLAREMAEGQRPEKHVWATSVWLGGSMPTKKEATYDLLAQALSAAAALGVQRLRIIVDTVAMARELNSLRRASSSRRSVDQQEERLQGLMEAFPDLEVVQASSAASSVGVKEEGEPPAAGKAGSSHDDCDNGKAAASPPNRSSGTNRKSTSFLMRFDGGSRGNPGPAGAGVVIYECDNSPESMHREKEVYSGALWLGPGLTNNEAEYKGLIEGLVAAKRLGIKRLKAEGDSQLVVRQLTGEYQVRNDRLKLLYRKAKDLVGDFEEFEISHIERESNARADFLANTAMDTRSSTNAYERGKQYSGE